MLQDANAIYIIFITNSNYFFFQVKVVGYAYCTLAKQEKRHILVVDYAQLTNKNY